MDLEHLMKFKKVEVMDYDVLESLLDKEALAKYKKNAMNPHTNPIERGGAENDDIISKVVKLKTSIMMQW